jgi:hypothetical protein
MSEYTKLTSDDNNSSYTSKFLLESIPLGKKFFRDKGKKENKQSEIELFDFQYKNNISNIYSNKNYNINSSGYGRVNQERVEINTARKGNMKMFLYNKNDEPMIVLGPDWFSSFIVITFFVFFLFLYFYFLKNIINPTIQYYGKILSFIDILLYLICILINPGIPPKELWIENYFKNKSNKDDDINFSIKICKDCKIIIESNQNIEHCKICNLCIIEQSYHCFWIGKCIGKKNKLYFFSFLFLSFILLLYLIFAFVSIPFFKEDINTK